jgi:hypothetical protein
VESEVARTISAKSALPALAASLSLGACAVVPVDGPYAEPYPAPYPGTPTVQVGVGVVAPPVVLAPPVVVARPPVVVAPPMMLPPRVVMPRPVVIGRPVAVPPAVLAPQRYAPPPPRFGPPPGPPPRAEHFGRPLRHAPEGPRRHDHGTPMPPRQVHPVNAVRPEGARAPVEKPRHAGPPESGPRSPRAAPPRDHGPEQGERGPPGRAGRLREG